MTKVEVITLSTEDLRAIVRSTNPANKFWLEMVWAQQELTRRWRTSSLGGPLN